MDKHGLNSSKKDVKGYFVVSEALRDYLIDHYKVSNLKNFYIAPCATAQTSEEYYQNYKSYREKYRNKYKIDNETKLIVYSGGISSWQCIVETVQLFNKIHDLLPKTKLLMLSHNIEEIKKITNNEKDIYIDKYSPDELTEVLCAGDFAIMLRKNCVTNNVAFPNKYLEYVKSKMKIITTPYVYEIAKQVSNFKIGFLYDFSETITELILYIKTATISDTETVKEVLELNSFRERLSKFYEDVL